MKQIIELLTEVEATNFAELETTIESGMQSFLQVGEALWKIREGKLYRATHKTFEAYCRERWGMTRSNAYLLMRESEAAKSVEGILQNPTREQARAVAKVEPERREEVLTKASESGPVTAKAIREAARPSPQVESLKETPEKINTATPSLSRLTVTKESKLTRLGDKISHLMRNISMSNKHETCEETKELLNQIEQL